MKSTIIGLVTVFVTACGSSTVKQPQFDALGPVVVSIPMAELESSDECNVLNEVYLELQVRFTQTDEFHRLGSSSALLSWQTANTVYEECKEQSDFSICEEKAKTAMLAYFAMQDSVEVRKFLAMPAVHEAQAVHARATELHCRGSNKN